MGRPPIIISNGGIAGKLAEGLDDITTKQDVEKRLMKNLNDMKNDESVISIIKTKNGKEAHCLYWRLADEHKYENVKDQKGNNKFGDGKETVSINELLDPL